MGGKIEYQLSSDLFYIFWRFESWGGRIKLLQHGSHAHPLSRRVQDLWLVSSTKTKSGHCQEVKYMKRRKKNLSSILGNFCLAEDGKEVPLKNTPFTAWVHFCLLSNPSKMTSKGLKRYKSSRIKKTGMAMTVTKWTD